MWQCGCPKPFVLLKQTSTYSSCLEECKVFLCKSTGEKKKTSAHEDILTNTVIRYLKKAGKNTAEWKAMFLCFEIHVGR